MPSLSTTIRAAVTRVFLLLAAAFLLAAPTTPVQAGVVDGAVFGLRPDSGSDCTAAFRKALEELRKKPGCTLKLAPGTYHFFATNANTRLDYQSNTDVVPVRRYAIFIEDAKGLTIDGQGATLMMHGEMSAIGVEGSEKITLKNLNIDWDRLLTSQATVVEQGPDWQLIELDGQRFPYSVDNGQLQMIVEGKKSRVWSTMEVDPETGRNLGDIWGSLKRAEEVAPGKVKIWGGRKVEKVGNLLALRHHTRSHAGIFIEHSERITLDHTELWATCGLGILCQQSRDLTFKNTAVRPRPGSGLVVGPKDDAFHFSGCSGAILIEGCKVECTPDDPINIHGTCLPVDRQVAGNTIRAHFGHDQSIGQIYWGKPGDEIALINRETLLPVEHNVIKTFRLLDPRQVEVVFEKPFKTPVTSSQGLENLSDTPSAVIRHCWFGNNRARGILCSTPRKVLIEENTFAVQGAAILIAGDANGWYESGAVRNVVIRRNTFDNCLIAPTQFSDGVIAIWPEIHRDVPGQYFHRNIRIEENTFRVFDRPILYAHNADGLSFVRNIIQRTAFRPPWHPLHDAMFLQHCRDVRIEKNSVTGELLSSLIAHPDTPASEIRLDLASPFRLKPEREK